MFHCQREQLKAPDIVDRESGSLDRSLDDIATVPTAPTPRVGVVGPRQVPSPIPVREMSQLSNHYFYPLHSHLFSLTLWTACRKDLFCRI